MDVERDCSIRHFERSDAVFLVMRFAFKNPFVAGEAGAGWAEWLSSSNAFPPAAQSGVAPWTKIRFVCRYLKFC